MHPILVFLNRLESIQSDELDVHPVDHRDQLRMRLVGRN